jgi:hypothetical protein
MTFSIAAFRDAHFIAIDRPLITQKSTTACKTNIKRLEQLHLRAKHRARELSPRSLRPKMRRRIGAARAVDSRKACL